MKEIEKEKPKLTVSLFTADDTYTNVLLLLIKNETSKPMIIDDYMLLRTGSTDYNLYMLDDDANFIDSYTLQAGESAQIGFARSTAANFFIYTTSLFAISLEFEGKMYTCAANKLGTTISITEQGSSSSNTEMRAIQNLSILDEQRFKIESVKSNECEPLYKQMKRCIKSKNY